MRSKQDVGIDFILPKTLRNGVDDHEYGFVTGKRRGKAAVLSLAKRRFLKVAKAPLMNVGCDAMYLARRYSARVKCHEPEPSAAGLLHRQ